MHPEYKYEDRGIDWGERNKPASSKFWMVVGDGNTPKVRHETRSRAEKESTRLAKENPGITFYVLEAVEKVTCPKPDVIKVTLDY